MDALERSEVVELEALLRDADGRAMSRSFLVATFLAVLELAKLATLRLFQSVGAQGAPEGPIRLRKPARREQEAGQSGSSAVPDELP